MTRTDLGEPSAPIDYLVIGHIAKDLTPSGPRLGGTVSYAGLTASALGCRTAVVTACDSDLDLSPLAGLTCHTVTSAASTTFENIYEPQGRRQYLRAQAAPLPIDAIPAAWRSASVLHVGPIAHEIATETLPDIIAMWAARRGGLVGLTPQGWLRQWDNAGRVRPAAWPEAANILPNVGAVVFSIEDVQGDWQLVGEWAAVTPILVVTQGAQGCTVFVRGQSPRSFAPPPQIEEDPTGAGDVFAAAFFIRLHESRDAHAAAHFANQVAARSVTRPGLAGVPTAAEVALLRQSRSAEGVAS